ncbi:MAG: GtrA family protein [Chloroflexi bacterium]|nr:GtrA family protein [Chloroflexota bacterium]
MRMSSDVIARFLKPEAVKFLIVGGSGTVVNLGLTFLLKEQGGLDPVVANGIAFVMSVINNYAWNTLWTFGQRGSVIGLGKYLAVSSLTLSLDLLIVYVLTKRVGVWYLAAAAVGIAAAVTINYAFSKAWVWRRKE